MNTENTTVTIIEQTSLVDTLKKMEETCSACKPLSMTFCVTDCKIWKTKNESRELHKRMQDPNFVTDLLNTIKNRRRLQILQIISRGQSSTDRLQQELKKLGHNHSQQTIIEEYIDPLVEVELAHEAEGKYYATAFGSKLNEITKSAQDIEDLLPPHSECYEEKILAGLINQPKTYEQFNGSISTRSIARVLSRLQTVGLVETNKEKDHVFFFKTQRNPNKEKLSPTEKKVHESISEDGISARKLAQRAQISLRRTYKYLRRLKGKKLVFTREKPRTYALTIKGLQLAMTLQKYTT
jgi:predicted transcriptional regulator/DNA-binding HxlR family transcriptional regulator